MKKFSTIAIAFVVCLAIFLFAGCSAETGASSSPLTSSPEYTPEVSNSPAVSNVLTSNEPAETAAYVEMTFGGYVYYSGPGSETENGYQLRRRNIETNKTEFLNYSASDIYSFGDNRYADVSVSDDTLYPTDSDEDHWMTCKIDKDGRIEKFIGGDAGLEQDNGFLYYTVYGEDCIFKSGLDCSNPVRIPVTPAGNENPFETLSMTSKGRLTAQIDIYSIEGGSINIGYDIINEQGQCCFSSGYKVFLSDRHIEESYPGIYYDNRIYKDEWLYYLDLGNPVESKDSEEVLFYIHRMNKDGGGDKNLEILCFSFDLAGQYLYTDTNITFGDFGYWDTYRYNLDGKGKKKIEYSNMTRFSKGGRLYFSLFDESAFYSATTACTKVKKYTVKLPDEEAIREKLKDLWEFSFVTVTDEKDGWVYFKFSITDTGPGTYYTGEYRMNLKSRKVEKVDKGEYSLGEEEEE